MQTIVLASGNQGKLRELQSLLKPAGYAAVSQRDFEVPEAEETGLSFVENAIIKARNACHHSGLPALADDSGLEVDALDGRPGIYSARFSGPGASDASNNEHLLDALRGVANADRTARYQCIIVAMRHARDPSPIICQGTWEGRILEQPAGSGGFGYDPLFLVEEYQCSAAQLPAAVKNHASHRGQAMRQLLSLLARL